MPYTQEELQELEFYQNLIIEDEERYLNERNLLMLRAEYSGSADLGYAVRDGEGRLLVFESPYTGEIFDEQDPTSMVMASRIAEQLINNISIDDIIDRRFGEL